MHFYYKSGKEFLFSQKNQPMKKQLCFILFLFLFLPFELAVSQPAEQPVKVMVSPNHSDWKYALGDSANFTVTVLQYSVPVHHVKVTYEVGLEKMKPTVKKTVTLEDGKLYVQGGTLQQPGFLRCIVTAEVDGKQYRNLATVGFDVLNIAPTVEKPADFDSFWKNAMSELSNIPLDAKMVLLPEKCSALSNVFQVNIQNYGNSRLYGILTIPKKEGKYPVVLKVPGAGVWPSSPDLQMADKGFIVLDIGIHGIPATLDTAIYNNLYAGALKNYQFMNADNKDRFYYKRVYLGCVRANDFLTSLPEYDGFHLGVTGGSQGGALSFVTASLDKRVKYLSLFCPALCDLTGYLKARAGGWPHFFSEANLQYFNKPEVINTLSYYDAVNFAKNLTVEGFYSWGYNDETCPPTTMYSAYNSINAPKTLSLYLDTGHWAYPDQRVKIIDWLLKKLKE
jgi:cephalosporin-C deacetylase-like acetyl esterase